MNTLLQVLYTIVRALAPFTPFITEHVYGLLKPYLGDMLAEFKDARSVHFLPFPKVQEALFDEATERKVYTMQKVIQLGRVARERCNASLKTPFLCLVVIADAQQILDLEPLKSYVQEELNVRDVILTTDEERYGILLEARVDWPTLGKKLKKDVQAVRTALSTLTQEQLKDYQLNKKMTLQGILLEENDLTIVRVLRKQDNADTPGQDGPRWEPAFAEDLIVLLDAAPHPELMDEGIAREIINRVQRLRKKAGLVPTDDVRMQYAVLSNPDAVEADSLISRREDLFLAALRRPLEGLEEINEVSDKSLILQEEHRVGNLTLVLRLVTL